MPEAVTAHTARAERRLARKFTRSTLVNHKRAQVAVTAVARELAGFMWVEMKTEALLGARHPGGGLTPVHHPYHPLRPLTEPPSSCEDAPRSRWTPIIGCTMAAPLSLTGLRHE